MLLSLCLFLFFSFEFFLQFDDLVGELFDLLFIDFGKVVSVEVVELFHRFSQLGVDGDQLLQRFLKGHVLLVQGPVLLSKIGL